MKRIKLISKRPNPLFELWLEEWKREAALRNSDLQYHFSKAIDSLRKYPLPLKSGKDCIILQHFGAKLCLMLDNKLEKHKAENNGLASTDDFICLHCNYDEKDELKRKFKARKETVDNECERQRPELSVFSKVNLQAWNLENYAGLMTLYEESQNPRYTGFITELNLLGAIKELCGKATKASVLNLVENGLFSMTGAPIRYNLTEHGVKVVKHIFEITGIDEKSINSVNTLEKVQTCLNSLFGQNSVSPKHITDIKKKSKKNTELRKQEKPRKTKNTNNSEADKVENNKTNSTDSLQKEIYLEPHKFDIILLVDKQEISGGKTKPQHDATIVELTQLDVLFEVRHLKVGDFAWIARCRNTNKELILPYIVERKRIDDLSASITDGRFHEQKFRLKQCGIKNLMYIIEEHDKGHRLAIPHSSLMQASINTLIQDGFSVKYTKNHKDSMFYLSSLTRIFIRTFKGKHLIGCTKETIVQTDSDNNSINLMEFQEFNKSASKQKVFQVSQMFIRQLLQLKGMSIEKAMAIVECYPTPQLLINALHDSDGSRELLISNIEFGDKKRLLGPTISKTIFQLYTRKNLN